MQFVSVDKEASIFSNGGMHIHNLICFASVAFSPDFSSYKSNVCEDFKDTKNKMVKIK